MELTKDYAWQLFLLLLLVIVLTYVVAMLLQFPVLFSHDQRHHGKRQPSSESRRIPTWRDLSRR